LISRFIITIVLLLPLASLHWWSGASGEGLSLSSKYNLPQFLQGRVTVDTYRHWLLVKAKSLHSRDLRKKRPYAKPGTWTEYRQAIHEAVVRAGEFDPFTGAALQWELISTWDDKSAKDCGQEYIKKFYLLPTADHTDPSKLDFEICSWLVNMCKTHLSADEFLNLCKTVTDFRVKK
jgi:hypothetical protein